MTAAPASAPASVAEASSKGDGEDDESEEEEEEDEEEGETRYASARFNSREKKQHFHSVCCLFPELMHNVELYFEFYTKISHVKSIGGRGEVDSAFSGEAERRSLRIEEVDASEEWEEEEEEEEESISSEEGEEADRYGSRLKETKKSKVPIVSEKRRPRRLLNLKSLPPLFSAFT